MPRAGRCECVCSWRVDLLGPRHEAHPERDADVVNGRSRGWFAGGNSVEAVVAEEGIGGVETLALEARQDHVANVDGQARHITQWHVHASAEQEQRPRIAARSAGRL